MKTIMNEENYLDHNVERDAAEGPVVCVGRWELLQAINEIKTVRVPGPSEISLEFIAASGALRIHVRAEICQKVFDGFGMSDYWALRGSNLRVEG